MTKTARYYGLIRVVYFPAGEWTQCGLAERGYAFLPIRLDWPDLRKSSIMEKSTPLDRADSLFKNTYTLGDDFEKEKWLKVKANPKVQFKLSMLLEEKTEKKVFDPFRWLDFFKDRVKEIRKAAASLTGWSKRTRYKKVADKVKAVWELCQKILDDMDSSNGQRIAYYKTKQPKRLLPDSVQTAAYLSFSTGLCTLGRDGFLAVKDAKKDEEKRASDPKRWETEIQFAKADPQSVVLPKKVKKGLGSIDPVKGVWVLPNGETVKLPQGRPVLEALRALVTGGKSYDIPKRGPYCQLVYGPKNLSMVLMRTVNKAKDLGLAFPEDKRPRIEGRKLSFCL